MKVFIYTKFTKDPLEAKESYATIKKRLFDNQPFMRVTGVEGQQVIYAKDAIKHVTGVEEAK